MHSRSLRVLSSDTTINTVVKTSRAMCLMTNSVGVSQACGGGENKSFYQDQFRIVYKQLPLKDAKAVLQVPQNSIIRIMVADENTLTLAHENTIKWLTLVATYCRDKADIDSLENANDLLTKAMAVEAKTGRSPHVMVMLFNLRSDVLSKLNRGEEIESVRKQFS